MAWFKKERKPRPAQRERLEIPADAWVLVQCHHGGRSMRVTQFLRSKGFARVSNLQGGIDAWSLKVDPKVPRY